MSYEEEINPSTSTSDPHDPKEILSALCLEKKLLQMQEIKWFAQGHQES